MLLSFKYAPNIPMPDIIIMLDIGIVFLIFVYLIIFIVSDVGIVLDIILFIYKKTPNFGVFYITDIFPIQ